MTVIASVGETAVIGKELKPGDHVVTEGQLRLSDGTLVKETIEAPAVDVAANTDGSGGTVQPSPGGTSDGAAPATGGSTAAAGAAPAGNS